MSSSSGAQPSSSSAKFREHLHGRQDRDFTSDQKAAVERIKRCKATAYYEILSVEKSSSDGQIKKAYHKLSLATHPDKNGAPGADEAFKLVSKAFQVLSDPQKREIFDQTGADPDSRGGGGGAGGARAAAGNPFAGFAGAPNQGPEISAEDLFNMFFGGGGGGGGVFANGGIFDDGTNGRPFGFGPGIRVQQFGGGPRMRRRATPAGAEEVPAQPQNLTRIFWQLAPLILFFLLPMLSGLFGGDGAGAAPKFTMEPKGLYTQQRFTPAHKVPFYVNPKDVEPLGTREATRLGQRAETAIINQLNAMCSREELIRQQKLQDAQGFFFTNDVKAKEAREMDMPDCRRLEELGLPRRRQY